MKQFMLSVSKEGQFLFRTDWDDHARTIDAANEICKGMPHLKVMMYSKEASMEMVDYFPEIYPYTTKLANIDDLDMQEDNIGRQSYYDLLDYFNAKLPVEVLGEDSACFFNVKLPNGRHVYKLPGRFLAQIPRSL